MKGISPLIAAVLLIAFTVAIATLIMGWMSTYTRTTTSNVTSQSETAVACGSAAIKIQHVYSKATNTSIVVSNTGFKDFTTVTGSVLKNDGTACAMGSISLSQGNVGYLSNSSSCFSDAALAAADFDRAIVQTECGGVGDSTDKVSDFTSG